MNKIYSENRIQIQPKNSLLQCFKALLNLNDIPFNTIPKYFRIFNHSSWDFYSYWFLVSPVRTGVMLYHIPWLSPRSPQCDLFNFSLLIQIHHPHGQFGPKSEKKIKSKITILIKMWLSGFSVIFSTTKNGLNDNSQFRPVNHSEISAQLDHRWWDHHCNDAILSHTLTLVAYAGRSEFTKFEAFWWIEMPWIPKFSLKLLSGALHWCELMHK